MASIVKESTGRRRVFFEHAGKRKSISLGDWNMKQAEGFKLRLEDLLISRSNGIADQDVEKWLRDMDDDQHAKLAAVDLVKPRAATSLKGWLERCIAEKSRELKPESIRKLKQTAAKLLAFFAANETLRTIDADDASRWRANLLEAKSSIAYVRSTCGNAKTLFAEAVRRGLIQKNPFEHLESGVTPARNDRYITPEEIEKILEACPNIRYKVLFAMARYAGIRIPSELPRWEQVDFATNRMTIRSPKTERHAGHESRQVPIDPRLMPILLEAHTSAPEGEQRVFWSEWSGGIHSTARSIVDRSGVQRWPDLFQALRRSCEMEWADQFPQYVVSKWIGHSIAVSGKHYANLVTDRFFDAASCTLTAAHKPERQTERAGAESQGTARNSVRVGAEIPSDSTPVLLGSVGAEGFEPPTKGL